MKKSCVVLGALVLGGCIVVVRDVGRPAVVVPTAAAMMVAPPRIVAVAGLSGVYYSPTDPNVLFYNGRWWRHYDGRWHYTLSWGRNWVVTTNIPLIFLRISRTLPVFGRLVVHHPKYKKPTATVRPPVKSSLVKPPRKTAKPPPKVKPAKPAKRPAVKQAKPGKKPEDKKKKKKVPKLLPWRLKRR